MSVQQMEMLSEIQKQEAHDKKISLEARLEALTQSRNIVLAEFESSRPSLVQVLREIDGLRIFAEGDLKAL